MSLESIEAVFPNAAQFDRIIAALDQIATNNASGDALDAAIQATLTGGNTTTAFLAWAPRARVTTADNWALMQRWGRILRRWCGDLTFTLRSYDAEVSGDPAMTPMDDMAGFAAGQLCTESTTPVADWTDEHPMGGWYVRVNLRTGSDGEPVISAIEGLDSAFDKSGELAPVHSMSLALWYKETNDGAYNYQSYRAAQAAGYAPMPWDVSAVDNSMREMTWHPCYPGGLDSSGHLTSGSGLAPLVFTTAASGLTLAQAGGAYEGLWSDCDTIWLLRMWQLRHHNLENSGVAEGCTSYDYQYAAALAEEGVKRVLLTTAQAANLLVGSCVIVGDPGTANTNYDRGQAYMRNLADRARIASIETVTVDGASYAAVNLDMDESIDVTATTRISTMPWYSGATDALPGHKDGALHSLTAGKGPIRVMGVEAMHGAYDIGLDPLWNVVYDSETGEGVYTAYEQRDSTKLASAVTNYTDTGISSTIKNGWQYVKRFIKAGKGVLLPDLFGGSSSTWFKSAFGGTSSSGVRCPWRVASLYNGGHAGLACANGSYAPSDARWTGRPRLSGSGAKRGEWQG